MRVRPLRPTANRTRTERRPHAPAPAPVAAAPVIEEHAAERRHRACVAPQDTAHYGCACGFQFQAPVSTSVSCPHCGAGQAW